jgi:hypothetical protein
MTPEKLVSRSTAQLVMAIAASYARCGYATFGLAWTPAAALDLHDWAPGLDDCFWINAWVRLARKNDIQLDDRTLLVVLDQPQIRLRDRATLLALAKGAGAKVVIAGPGRTAARSRIDDGRTASTRGKQS